MAGTWTVGMWTVNPGREDDFLIEQNADLLESFQPRTLDEVAAGG